VTEGQSAGQKMYRLESVKLEGIRDSLQGVLN